MSRQPDSNNRSTPRWVALLLLAYGAHVGEEWWGGPGFSEWTRSVLGAEVSASRFLAINTIAFLLFAVAVIVALRNHRFGWIAEAPAALLFLNGRSEAHTSELQSLMRI